MGKSLYIAEKPSVAQEFAKALHINGKKQDGYLESEHSIVTWCVGHLVTMSYPEVYDPALKKWSMETIPFLPSEWKYEVISSVKKQYEIVKRLLNRSDVDTIYVCTDSGREGEYIYRLVEQMAQVKGKKRLRVWIDSQTEEEIQRGIAQAKDLSEYDNLSASAYLRAKEDYLKAEEDYHLASQKYALVVERLRQDSISRTIQMEEMETSLANMRRNIALVHERKEHLNVRSQIDGELGLLDVVLGQNVSPGQMIGQINDLSDYKIEAMIDEHYIDRVKPGLSATFERQGVNYALTVRKVYPEVREGKFRTDFVFTGKRPDNIRSGQTYYINLELGQPTESIIIPRGTFFQSTGGNWIYVLDKEGKKAYRRPIKIGRQNPQYYEVLEGLEAGEKVIVSSYESFKDNEVLILGN